MVERLKCGAASSSDGTGSHLPSECSCRMGTAEAYWNSKGGGPPVSEEEH